MYGRTFYTSLILPKPNTFSITHLMLLSNQHPSISFHTFSTLCLYHVDSNLELEFCGKLLRVPYFNSIISFHNLLGLIASLHSNFTENALLNIFISLTLNHLRLLFCIPFPI